MGLKNREKVERISKKKSIKTGMVLVLVVLSILPLLVMGGISYSNSKRALYDNMENNSLQQLNLLRMITDKSFDGFQAMLDMIGNSKNSIQLIDGTYVVDGEEIENELNVAKETNSDILNIYFGEANGTLHIAPLTVLDDDFDHRERNWYIEAVNKPGEFYYNDAYIDTTSDKAIITVSKAVEKNGKLLGVVALDIDLANLSEILSSVAVGKEGYMYIADESGVIIAHKDEASRGQRLDEIENTKIWWNEEKDKANNFIKVDEGDKNVFIGHLNDEYRGWKLISKVEESELLEYTNKLRDVVLLLATVMVILVILTTYLVTKYVDKILKTLLEGFKRASNGDLSAHVELDTNDEFESLGESFNNMIDTIRDLVVRVRNSSDIINETSENVSISANQASIAMDEISITVDQVAQGAISQATDTNEGVHMVEDLSKEMNNIEAMANDMGEISSKTHDFTKNGVNHMQSLLDKTEMLNETTNNMTNAMSEMTKVTNEIGVITETINQISAQTNLLALNAAIEAARAGEAGRGFAVVAEEIRNLAEESGSATEDIKNRVEDIKGKASAVVSYMEQNREAVNLQNTSVEDTRNIFNDITDSIEELIDGIDHVKNTVNKTNENAEEIVGRMFSISAVSEENSASIEEVSASTEEVNATMTEFNETAKVLSNLSEELKKQLEVFKL